MQLHSPLLLGVGAGLLVLGVLFWRWASRHRINLSGAALSTAYAAVKGGSMPTVPDDLKARYDTVAAASSNAARAKLVGGSVARHLLARFVSIAGLVSMLAGLALIAASVLWK